MVNRKYGEKLVNNKIGIAVSILFIFCFSRIGVGAAQMQTFGVEIGDMFLWDVEYTGRSMPEIGMYDLAGGTFQIIITSFLEDGFSTRNVATFKNGTKNEYDSGYNPGKNEFDNNVNDMFIMPNLNANDKILASDPYSFIVKETVTRNYLNETRETNHVSFPPYFLSDGNYKVAVDSYYDRKTGVLVEKKTNFYEKDNPEAVLTVSFTLKETTIWTVPEFPSLVIVMFLVSATLLGAILYRRMHLEGQKMYCKSLLCFSLMSFNDSNCASTRIFKASIFFFMFSISKCFSKIPDRASCSLIFPTAISKTLTLKANI